MVLNRREFIKASALALLATRLRADNLSQVVLARNSDLFRYPQRKEEIIGEMLDQACRLIFQSESLYDFLAKKVKPDDYVGIKSNVWRYLPTPAEVENVLVKAALKCGVSQNRVSVNDRGVLKDEVFKRATVLINVRPMRAHAWSGMGSCLKNYIMFTSRPADYHPDSCADLGALWHLPQVKNKTVLNILVLFTPLFHGVGPHDFNPQYLFEYGGMVVGEDVVAVDATGARIIEAKRKEFFGYEKPISPPVKHIELADKKYHLGNSSAEKIKIHFWGDQQNRLI